MRLELSAGTMIRWDFEATDWKVRSEAKTKGKLRAPKANRQVNNSTSNNTTTANKSKTMKRKKKNKKRRINNAGTKPATSPNNSDAQGDNLGLPHEIWAKMNKDQRKLYLEARNGARSTPNQFEKQYTKKVNQAQTGSHEDCNHEDETVANGNIWRAIPTKKVAMARRRLAEIYQEKKKDKEEDQEDEVFWLSQEEANQRGLM